MCDHPPNRLWAWFARDDTEPTGDVLCVACCDCGAVLAGGAESPKAASSHRSRPKPPSTITSKRRSTRAEG